MIFLSKRVDLSTPCFCYASESHRRMTQNLLIHNLFNHKKKTYLCLVGWHGRYVEVVCIRMHPLCAQSIRALILTRTDITFAASSVSSASSVLTRTFAASSADAMQGCDGEGGRKNSTANFLSMKSVLTVKCYYFLDAHCQQQ